MSRSQKSPENRYALLSGLDQIVHFVYKLCQGSCWSLEGLFLFVNWEMLMKQTIILFQLLLVDCNFKGSQFAPPSLKVEWLFYFSGRDTYFCTSYFLQDSPCIKLLRHEKGLEMQVTLQIGRLPIQFLGFNEIIFFFFFFLTFHFQ